MTRQLAIVLTGFALFWYALNVPAQQVRISKFASDGQVTEKQIQSPLYAGGFPWKYCEFQQNSTAPLNGRNVRIYRFQSNANWCWNIATGIVLAAGLALIVLVRNGKRSDTDDAKSVGLQLSLSSLLVLVTLFAGSLGYYRIGQQRLVDDMSAIAQSGGICAVAMNAPKWLGNAIDLSFLMKLQSATINRAQCNDAQFKRIAKIRSLSSISISYASTTDIDALAKLPNLTKLSISDCEFTDGMLNAIRSSTMISKLSLRDLQSTPTTDQIAALQDIIANSEHEWGLSLPVFSNVPLQLENVRQLRFLELTPFKEGSEQGATIANNSPSGLIPSDGTPKVGDFSVTLKNLPRLSSLSIRGTISQLTIKNVPSLKQLTIPDQVSDALELEDLTSLFRLDLGLVRFPKVLKLSGLPTLSHKTKDTSYGPSGIIFSGRLTESMINSLGDYAGTLAGIRSMTMEAFVAWLPSRNATRLNFNSLRIERNEDSTADLSSLPDLDHIESVLMPRLSIVGATLHPGAQLYPLLAKLPNLRELYLDGNFTDDDARHLSRLAKLEIFTAVDTQMTDAGWSQLPYMPNLRTVSLPQRVTRLQLRDLPKFESVHWGDASLKSLVIKNLPALKTKVHIDANSRLETVSIENAGEIDLELDRIPAEFKIDDTAIVHVIATGDWVTDEDLQRIVSPETAKLDISRSSISSMSVDILVSLNKLRFLDVSATSLTEADIQRLIAETEIERLEVQGIELSDATIDSLPEGEITRMPRGLKWPKSMPTLDNNIGN